MYWTWLLAGPRQERMLPYAQQDGRGRARPQGRLPGGPRKADQGLRSPHRSCSPTEQLSQWGHWGGIYSVSLFAPQSSYAFHGDCYYFPPGQGREWTGDKDEE